MSSEKPGVQTETKVETEMHDTLGVIFLGIVALLLALMLMRTLRHNRELVALLQKPESAA